MRLSARGWGQGDVAGSMLVCGICRVVPLVPGARTVLVVVSGVDAADRVAAVTLLSPDVVFGTSLDLMLPGADSGLRYDLLVESDVFGYVPADRLGEPLGRVSLVLIGALAGLRDDDLVGWPVAGPPVVCRDDPRWLFKLGELARLRSAIQS